MARPLPGTTVATAAVASANVTANADRIRIGEPARTCLSPMSGLGGRRDVLARWSDPRSPADFERQMTTCMAAATMSHEQSTPGTGARCYAFPRAVADWATDRATGRVCLPGSIAPQIDQYGR